jgi:hypothetical protein
MSKYMFGTASEQDLLVLQTHMKTIISRTDKLTHSFEQHAVNLSSYMTAIDNRVSNAMKGIENNNHFILTTRMDIQSSLTQLTKAWSSIISMLIKDIEATTALHTRCQEIFQGIHNLLSHRLSILSTC